MDEPLAAYSTLVRFLAGVGHDVMLEGFRLTEGTIAIGAVVRLDAAVNDFDVPTHVAWNEEKNCNEGFSAVRYFYRAYLCWRTPEHTRDR